MATEPANGSDLTRGGGNADERLDSLVAAYVDRFLGGERIDEEEVAREHPDLAPELLERLRVYQELGAETSPAAAPGRVGEYKLVRRLGRGGMGIVYEAWQESMERRVALKVLPGSVSADSRTLARFLREAKVAAKLHHPAIVPVFGMAIASDVAHYAMELVEGETLAQVLEKLKRGGTMLLAPGAPNPFAGSERDLVYCSRVAEAFAGIAEGLHHAHSHGVVHRDVKPSNLILDRLGRLRILDFGLARLEGKESLTLSGDLLGTPLYMSPEQARARKVPIDHRTDVYSLGATLYEALTLRPPLQGKDHQDTLSQVISRDPPPCRRFNPRVPRDLETVVLKCLEKEPALRYATAEALAQDLRRAARGDAVEARPQAAWERLRRRLWRHRARVLVVAAVLLLVSTSSLLLLNARREAARREDALCREQVLGAVLDLHLAWMSRESPAAGDPGAFYRTEYFDLLDPYLSLGEGSAVSVEGSVVELSRLAAAFPAQPDACYHLARALLHLGREEEALKALDLALRREPRFLPAAVLRAEVLEGKGDSKVLERTLKLAADSRQAAWASSSVSAHRHLAARRWHEASVDLGEAIERVRGREPYIGALIEARLERAMAFLRARELDLALEELVRVEEGWPGAAEPLLLKGQVYLAKGRKDLAAGAFQSVFDRATAKDAAALWIAGTYVAAADYAKALAWADQVSAEEAHELGRFAVFACRPPFHEAVEAGERILEKRPGALRVRPILAWVLCEVGRPADAAAHCREVLKAKPDLPWAHWHLGHALLELGQEAEALEMFEREIQLQPGNPSVPTDSAFQLMHAKKLDEAVAMGRRALALDAGSATAHLWLGNTFLHMGKHEQARDACLESIRLNSQRAVTHNILGLALCGLGRKEEGRKSFLKALEIDPGFTEAYLSLGGLLQEEGRIDEALACFEKDIAANPTSRYSHFAMAAALERAGRLDEALQKYCDALRAWPRHPQAHGKVLGMIRREERPAGTGGALRGLGEFFERAREQGTEDPRVLGTLALTYLHGEGRRDVRRALELGEVAAERSRRQDPDILSVLAEAELENGEAGLAARTAAEAIELPGARAFLRGQLDAACRAALPDLPCLPCIERLLAAREDDAERGAGDLERFRAVVTGDDALFRALYLEGRILERAGRQAEAAARFEAALAEKPASVEALLRLAGSLRAAARPADAARRLREALASGLAGREVWELWLAISFVDLGRPPAELLTELPAAKEGTYAADLRWLLERLEAGEPLRLNAGGEDYQSVEGVVWSRDRFFTAGNAAKLAVEIQGTRDAPLYQTERWFAPEGSERPGYRLPLPPGSYRVTLHFAEVWFTTRGSRVFDVLVEGEKVLEAYEPLAAGFGVPEARESMVEVTDGLLEVELLHRADNPKVSAIEVARVE